jgi:hypothetical protein
LKKTGTMKNKMITEELKNLYETEFKKAYNNSDRKEAIRLIGNNPGLVNYISSNEEKFLWRGVFSRMLDGMIEALDMEELCLK